MIRGQKVARAEAKALLLRLPDSMSVWTDVCFSGWSPTSAPNRSPVTKLMELELSPEQRQKEALSSGTQRPYEGQETQSPNGHYL